MALLLALLAVLIGAVAVIKINQEALARRGQRLAIEKSKRKAEQDRDRELSLEIQGLPKLRELEYWWENNQPCMRDGCVSPECWTHNPPTMTREVRCDSPWEHLPHQWRSGGYSKSCRGWGMEVVNHVNKQVALSYSTPAIRMDNGCQCGPGEVCTICSHAAAFWLDRQRKQNLS